MPKYAQLIMGPAGSGKSTYCSTIQRHCKACKRTAKVFNLDPAAEQFDYDLYGDIRELVCVEDVMEDDDLRFGPNGGLVFCMEYFAKNFDWLDEQLDDIDDDYFIFDCPGQIELYTHIPVMRLLVDHLQARDFRICGVFIIDSQFMVDSSKYVSGLLAALSAMVNLEIAHVNVMTKLDLLSRSAKKRLEEYLDPDLQTLLADGQSRGSAKFARLNDAIASLIDDYGLVKFAPLDQSSEESIGDVLLQIDLAIQYGEDLEPTDPDGGMADEVDDGFSDS
ncbi:GPN-loop GTPase 3-like [Watersipora subatra]|uniref:GPN-loop GTPase 3-like n=1 Tax=Watersipora subatra TaxID=2589382 RepID=UPI00355BF115